MWYPHHFQIEIIYKNRIKIQSTVGINHTSSPYRQWTIYVQYRLVQIWRFVRWKIHQSSSRHLCWCGECKEWRDESTGCHFHQRYVFCIAYSIHLYCLLFSNWRSLLFFDYRFVRYSHRRSQGSECWFWSVVEKLLCCNRYRRLLIRSSLFSLASFSQ